MRLRKLSYAYTCVHKQTCVNKLAPRTCFVHYSSRSRLLFPCSTGLPILKALTMFCYRCHFYSGDRPPFPLSKWVPFSISSPATILFHFERMEAKEYFRSVLNICLLMKVLEVKGQETDVFRINIWIYIYIYI